MTRRTPGRMCEVHGLELQPGHTTIFYGLPDRSWFGAWMQVQRSQFPHANSGRAGGCCISDDSPRRDEVLFCPKCREGLARWQAEWEAPRGPRRRGPGSSEFDGPTTP